MKEYISPKMKIRKFAVNDSILTVSGTVEDAVNQKTNGAYQTMTAQELMQMQDQLEIKY